MNAKYAIGLDYGTNSVRALVVNVASGREVGTAVWSTNTAPLASSLARPESRRQHPPITSKALSSPSGRRSPRRGKTCAGSSRNSRRIGVDTTGSTPMPVDHNGQPLAFDKRFARNPRPWPGCGRITPRRGSSRDHRAGEEAAPAVSRQVRWYLLQRMVLQQNPPLPAHRAASIRRRLHLVECADWIPAALTGTEHPTSSPWHLCRWPTRRCITTIGAVTRTRNSSARLIPSSANCARGSGQRRLPLINPWVA